MMIFSLRCVFLLGTFHPWTVSGLASQARTGGGDLEGHDETRTCQVGKNYVKAGLTFIR